MDRQERLKDLGRQLEGLRSSEGFKAWLACRSKFASYSWRNQFLIALQRPDATAVQGYATWREKYNRQVVKGARAIWILAPMLRKVMDGDKQRVNEKGEPVMKLGYRATMVFAVEDTVPIAGRPVIDLLPPFRPLEGDDGLSATGLLEWAVRSEHLAGFEFVEGLEAYGTFSPAKRWIKLRPVASGNQLFSTAVHELAHALAVEPASEYGFEELVAEATAWTVCQSVGLDTSCESLGYILRWEQDAPEKLEEAAAEISRRAKIIEGGLVRQEVPA